MGIITSIKVVRLALGLGLCLLLVPESSPALCAHRRQYWHEQREKCVNCTACQAGQIVIRPCQVHRDAQCGPISELNIDWSFLSRRANKPRGDNLDLKDVSVTPHHRGSEHKHSKHTHKDHSHQRKHHRKNHHKEIDRHTFEHDKHKSNSKAHHAHHSHHAIKPESFQLSSDFHQLYLDTPREVKENSAKLALLPESAALRRIPASTMVPRMGHVTPVPFSAVEKLVWDWQAVVLVLAVFACLLFFIVTGIYSIYHARHWRRFKGSFESDMEEAYARRSLMVPGDLESHAAPPPLDPYIASQGLCMDQLLGKLMFLADTLSRAYLIEPVPTDPEMDVVVHAVYRKKQEDLGTPKGNFYIVRDKSGDAQESN